MDVGIRSAEFKLEINGVRLKKIRDPIKEVSIAILVVE